MKLRYYLRGFGLGILLTTIILSIANADKQPMTDAEVRVRAAQLGMVESGSQKLSSVQEAEQPTKASEETPEAGTTEKPTAAPTEKPAEVVTETPEVGTTGKPTEAPTEKPTEAPTEKPTEAPTEKPAEVITETPAAGATEKPADGSAVVIVIKSGSGSETVARQMADAGLVESAKDFDKFLCANGYANKIRVGTYEIPMGASEEEIAKMIAR